MHRKSFLKNFHNWTTNFLNKNTGNIPIIRTRSTQKTWCLWTQILVWNKKSWFQFTLEKKILCKDNSPARAHIHLWKLFLSVTKRKLCSCFLVMKKKSYHILVSWFYGYKGWNEVFIHCHLNFVCKQVVCWWGKYKNSWWVGGFPSGGIRGQSPLRKFSTF